MSHPLYVNRFQVDIFNKLNPGQDFLSFCEYIGIDVVVVEPITKSPWEEYLEQQRKVADVPKVSSLRGFGYRTDKAIFDEAVSFVEAGNGATDKEESLATLEHLGFRPGALCCRLARGGV